MIIYKLEVTLKFEFEYVRIGGEVMYMFNLAEKEIAITEAVTISELVKGLPEPDSKKIPFL